MSRIILNSLKGMFVFYLFISVASFFSIPLIGLFGLIEHCDAAAFSTPFILIVSFVWCFELECDLDNNV